MNKFVFAAFIVAAGVLVWYLGGLTRGYPAFGGEEVLLLCAIGYAIHVLTKKEEER